MKDVTARTERLARLRSVLICPTCGGGLDFGPSEIRCTGCNAAFPVRDGRIYFIDVERSRGDSLYAVKARLSGMLGKLYPLLTTILGPVLLPNYGALIRRHFDPSKQIVVELGSSERRSDPDVICVDIIDYDAVDIVCDIHSLPFKSGSIDGLTSWNVIEHLARPTMAIAEIIRCLAPGGITMHEIPFMVPFHDAPQDYQRFTHQGARMLMQPLETIEQKNLSGPASLISQVVVEVLATVLSFGLPRPRAYLYLVLAAVISPVKFLDLAFVGRDSFIGLAPTILTVARKAD